MKRLTLLVAVSAIGVTLLFGSNDASAKADTTNKQTEKKIVVTVKEGDTLTKIAKRHKTTYVRLFNANKQVMNPDQINVGDKVIIPKKGAKLKDRFGAFGAAAQAQTYAPQYYQTAPGTNYTYTQSTAPGYAYSGSSAGNTYYQGYCTWYAKNKRPDLPNMLGNGGQWTSNAAARGYKTGSRAQAGAIAETPGHVMYVEKVYGNGTMRVSEMNGRAGFGKVGTRVVSTKGHSYIYK